VSLVQGSGIGLPSQSPILPEEQEYNDLNRKSKEYY